MSFAGALAATGRLELAAVIAIGTAGELIGALVAYTVGRTGGRALVDRFGKYVLIAPGDLVRAERWFARRGEPGIFFGRMIPLVRAFISLPAGIAEMPVVRFGVFTALGSLVWTGALAGVGYGLGGRWHEITKGFDDAGYVLLGVIVVAVAAVIVHRWRGLRMIHPQPEEG